MARAKYYSPLILLLKEWRLKKIKATTLVAIIDSDPILGVLQAHARGKQKEFLWKDNSMSVQALPGRKLTPVCREGSYPIGGGGWGEHFP